MTDTHTFVVPDHLEREVDVLIRNLQGLSESDLFELAERHRQRVDPATATLISGWLVWENPVDGVESALDDLRVAEHNHRYNVIQTMEAELQGGHLVSAGLGNQFDKFAAICDPRPPGPFCWEGPDRDTIEEAIADGRAHHPGYEPRVKESVPPLP